MSSGTKARSALLFAGLFAAGALAGCATDSSYCDLMTCYACDGVGCRSVPAPARTRCGSDSECRAGQFCSATGCVSRCRTLRDCTAGWDCRVATGATDGVCVAPTEATPTPIPTPTGCTTDAQCTGGMTCVSGTCRTPTPTPTTCTADSQCTAGQLCVSGRCTARSDTCQFDTQCGAGRVCVNSQCRVRCGGSVVCPTGQACVSNTGLMYCSDSVAPMCTSSAQCASGQTCLAGQCLTSCMPGGTTCGSAELYCSDEGVCRPDTRPRAFCDATHPCGPGSECVGGVCRVPCAASPECQSVDVTFRNCGRVPYLPEVPRTFCLTDNEARPRCARQSECNAGQSCIDGVCR